jgi:glutamyl-tRNA reductase
MNIFILGAGHQNTPVEIRERLQNPGCLTNDFMFWLLTTGLLEESLVLSTCNRLEAVGFTRDPAAARAAVVGHLSEKTGILESDLERHLHFFQDSDAVRHLFRMAAGLESQVLGETQILGQMKDAYRQATIYRTVGPVVSRLFHKCFQVAKKIRTETSVAGGRVSIASAAVGTADSAMEGGLKGKSVLVIGAGEMATLVLSHLRPRETGPVTIVSRSPGRARELAGRFGASVMTTPQLGEALVRADAVFSAAGSSGFVLKKDDAEPVLAQRGGRPIGIFDLGVPRNADPALAEIPGVRLVNIDDFNMQVKNGVDQRKREALKADSLIREEVEKFGEWFSALAARPTIKGITAMAEEARVHELRRTISRNDFTREEVVALDSMTRALVRRLLHNPLSFTKSCHKHWRAEFSLSMVRKIFGLDA